MMNQWVFMEGGVCVCDESVLMTTVQEGRASCHVVFQLLHGAVEKKVGFCHPHNKLTRSPAAASTGAVMSSARGPRLHILWTRWQRRCWCLPSREVAWRATGGEGGEEKGNAM
jgi:hypothetical protein